MTNQMTYQTTHPWLTFTLDLRSLPPLVWAQLGECAAKGDLISGVPLRPTISSELHTLYLAKGIQATTAIEGNTLSEDEVKQILENKLEMPPSKGDLKQEVKNIEKAFAQISDHIAYNVEVMITSEIICAYNAMVLDKIPIGEDVVPGKLRQHRVVVGKYLAPNASDVPFLIDKLCDWLNSDYFIKEGYNKTVLAILKAIVTHVYLAWIHPFGDGNGRIARLLEYKILAQSGVPLVSAHLLSSHYNATRTQYYIQLDKASKTQNGLLDFIAYAIQGFLDGLNEQLALIKKQQVNVALRSYIHERFRDKKDRNWRRKRDLALELSMHDLPVKKSDIPLLNRELGLAYIGKSSRTILRDIEELKAIDLVNETESGITINQNIILAFLPIRKA